jgi:hypothetical protein
MKFLRIFALYQSFSAARPIRSRIPVLQLNHDSGRNLGMFTQQDHVTPSARAWQLILQRYRVGPFCKM